MGVLSIVAVTALLTLVVICSIFLAAFVRLWRTPPEVNVRVKIPDIFVSVPIDIPPITVNGTLAGVSTFKLPDNINIQLTQNPSKIETDKPTDEAIPEEILLYIEQESDTWAQEARKRRARLLKAETGSWDATFRMLQREDNPE